MSADGMTYAPKGKPAPVVEAGDFVFAAVHLDHGHIYAMCNGLNEAGGTLRWVYDADSAKVKSFQERHPDVRVASSLDEILDDAEVHLVAAAAVPNERGPLGLRVMAAGKDYFTDKGPFTTLEQLEDARRTVKETGQRYHIYYGERLHSECAMFAGDLVDEGAIGRVIQVLGLGPHRLNAPKRPDWFFEKEKYGGILADIGSHQIEQFLTYTGSKDATVASARVANFNNPNTPELEDFGETNLVGDTGASGYFRVDWFTPDGLSSWGDGRTFILGTDGYIELRKYTELTRDGGGDQLYLVDGKGEQHMKVSGKVGFRYFGQLILDVLNRTETAMTQEHAFKAAELCLKAQALADEAP